MSNFKKETDENILKSASIMLEQMVTTARKLCGCTMCIIMEDENEDDMPTSCVATIILKPMVENLIEKFDFDPAIDD